MRAATPRRVDSCDQQVGPPRSGPLRPRRGVDPAGEGRFVVGRDTENARQQPVGNGRAHSATSHSPRSTNPSMSWFAMSAVTANRIGARWAEEGQQHPPEPRVLRRIQVQRRQRHTREPDVRAEWGPGSRRTRPDVARCSRSRAELKTRLPCTHLDAAFYRPRSSPSPAMRHKNKARREQRDDELAGDGQDDTRSQPAGATGLFVAPLLRRSPARLEIPSLSSSARLTA